MMGHLSSAAGRILLGFEASINCVDYIFYVMFTLTITYLAISLAQHLDTYHTTYTMLFITFCAWVGALYELARSHLSPGITTAIDLMLNAEFIFSWLWLYYASFICDGDDEKREATREEKPRLRRGERRYTARMRTQAIESDEARRERLQKTREEKKRKEERATARLREQLRADVLAEAEAGQ